MAQDAPKPAAITPIRPVERTQAFDNPEWIFELKHDGFRALAYIDNVECRLVSRNNYTFPQWTGLKRWLAEHVQAENAIFDGELVCLDDQGRSQFYDLFFRRKEPVYYTFDLLWLNGEDLREHPLSERKERLKDLIPAEPGPILLADHVIGNGPQGMRARPRGHRGEAADGSVPREDALGQGPQPRLQPEGRPLGIVQGPVALTVLGG